MPRRSPADPRTLGAQRRRLLSCLKLIRHHRGMEYTRMCGGIPLDLQLELGIDPWRSLQGHPPGHNAGGGSSGA